ncbi:MAG: glycine zipper 2TM domain-containing protein [Boseongicola sp. SB0664_bin_43]|uniref:17 kDa surface antigen n=1 Tax=Boseongicola sp. SB0664_bin_43 TaxID=2604844 RepID=A0A6B0Y5J0_9RHOB|nr:glycine zipper 2TM domain-containing protein [Boseongicola sp. SB0664_bin_43]MYK32815.1 glycine zipper 2TM domain-containing protein [Boseongicola sp. SB0670_bin_30]
MTRRSNAMKGTIRTTAALALAVTLGGCMGSNELAGTTFGGIAGGVIGNQFGDGDGKVAATALGAVVGASLGGALGRSLDEQSRAMADRATLQAVTSGSSDTYTWENPANSGGPAAGQVNVTRVGSNSAGQPCREYVSTVMIAGESQKAVGVACREADGSWRIQ